MMWIVYREWDTIAFLIVLAVLAAGFFRQAGYSRLWGLAMLIPIGNAVVLCVFAFREWPITRELARHRLGNGEGTAEDAKSVFYQAAELERRGDKQRAIDLFKLVAASGLGEAANEATEYINLANETKKVSG